jgi:hypothetical protein
MPGKTQFPNGGTNDRATLNRFYNFPFTSGNVRFVHASGAGTSGPGWAVENAYTTIDSAIGACTADNGDVIVVCEGHTESVTAAAGIALDVAGVKILGLGEGRRRPRVTFTTATGASFDISAARCVVENLVLINGIDAQTAMVNVTAADCVIQDCEFQLGDACTQAALGVLTTAAGTRLTVRRCKMHGSVDAGVTAAIRLVGGNAHVIEDNEIVGAFATTGCISNITTAATMIAIRRNHLLNRTADGNNKLIVLDASTTGLVVENRGGIIDSTCPAPVTGAGTHVGGNWFSSAAGTTASVLM